MSALEEHKIAEEKRLLHEEQERKESGRLLAQLSRCVDRKEDREGKYHFHND